MEPLGGSESQGSSSGSVPGWEPFVEPWPCFLSWQQQAAGRLHPPRLKMEVRARHRLDVNITSVLLGKCSSPTH